MLAQARRQAGGSSWGQSDEVVYARNRVAVAETERALAEGCQRIMILYGGLHIHVRLHVRVHSLASLKASLFYGVLVDWLLTHDSWLLLTLGFRRVESSPWVTWNSTYLCTMPSTAVFECCLWMCRFRVL